MEETTALEVALRVLRDLIESLRAAEASIRAGEADGIHHMRTAIGRLRAVLATVRPVLDREITDDLRDRLGSLVQVLQPARDAQVRGQHATKLVAHEGSGEFPTDARTMLIARFAGEEAEGRSGVTEYLASSEYRGLLDDLDLLTVRPALGPRFAAAPNKVLRKALHKLARRTVDLIGSADPGNLASIHDARKAVRRFRYAAEALLPTSGSLSDGRWSTCAARARDLQDALGDYRDARLFVERLHADASDPVTSDGKPTYYGTVAAEESERADAMLHKVRRAAKRYRKAVRSL